MSETVAENIRSQSPGTPPPADEIESVLSRSTPSPSVSDNVGKDETPSKARGRKRHRRAKGKKKKQKMSLLITNEDGTNSTADTGLPKQKKVFLRPSASINPLLKAPKNSTQFIIDDHENSNLFWNFDSNRMDEQSKDELECIGDEGNDINDVNDDYDGQFDLGDEYDRYCSDYYEKDFECAYEKAHQEEICSWNRTRIIEEISTLEKRQKQLIEMLSQIDPLIYLQKLQNELLALQEQNRQLKLINIAEKLEREKRRKGSRNCSPRLLPDSTTEVEGEESKDAIENQSSDSDDSSSSSSSSSSSDDDSDDGGCSSGCCLAQPCSEIAERLREVEEEDIENCDNQDDIPDNSMINEVVEGEESSVIVDEAQSSQESGK